MDTDWQRSLRTITLVSNNYAPAAGIFCAGYFLHVIGVPILRNARQPENNKRDLFLGYFFVFISYIIIGGLGYIGFIGYTFQEYFAMMSQTKESGQINQNCMTMFPYQDVMAFIIRLSIFLMILSGFPMLHYFVGKLIEELLFRGKEISRFTHRAILIGLNVVGFLFAIFYPNVGSVLAYVGSISGFLIIYTIPVLVHLS